jgi:hypothetical protein
MVTWSRSMTSLLAERKNHLMTKLILPALLLLGISGAAMAADINGKWTAEVEGRNGTVTQTLVLNTSGNNLTGSFEGARGGPVAISDGTIDGNKVSFKIVREFNGNQFTQQYKGTLSDSGELDLAVSMGNGTHRGGGGFSGSKGGRGGQGGQRNLVFKKAAD